MSGATWPSVDLSHGSVFVRRAVSLSGDSSVVAKLTPLYMDNLTEWLPLEAECKFRLPRGHLKAEERVHIGDAFYHWMEEDGLDHSRSHTEPRDPNRPMHDLHRLYWAIRSNRPHLASMLMHRVPPGDNQPYP